MGGADAASRRQGAEQLRAAIRALRQDPRSLRILLACTIAAVVTVFEPPYLTLSTSVIQGGLRVPNSPTPMILAAAFLVLALITLLAGTSADLFGRRRFLILGLVGLTLSNLLAMASLGTSQLFAVADLINTVSGVIVLPASIAIVTLAFDQFVRPFAYGVLFGIQGTALVVGSLLIPLLGEVWDGRATFVPVLILGVVALVLVPRHVRESKAPASLRRGSVMLNLILTAGLFAVLFLVVTAGIRSSESLLALTLTLTLVLIVAVIRWLGRRSRRFTQIKIYGGRDLGLAIFAGLMLMFAEGCFFYQTGPFFYDVQQVGDIEFALRYVPFVVGLLLGGVLVARLALRFGARRILALSFVLTGASLLGLSLLQVDTPFWMMIVPITAFGLAMGLGSPTRTTIVMGAPPEGLVNSAAAVNTAAGQGGYALGVIVSSVLVTKNADALFIAALDAAGVPPETVAVIASGLEDTVSRLTTNAYPSLPAEVEALARASYANAFTSGMTQVFAMVAMVMFVMAALMLVGMRRGLRATLAAPSGSFLPGDEAP
ncbi:MAG: MFS transporter [Propionicimonas sp.]